MENLEAYMMGLGFSEQSAGGIYVPDEKFVFSSSRGLYVDESRLTAVDRFRKNPILGSLAILAGALAAGAATLSAGTAQAQPLASHCHSEAPETTPGFNTDGIHNVTAGAYFNSAAEGIPARDLGLGLAVSYDQIQSIDAECLPYDGAQLSLNTGLLLEDGTTPFLVASGATPRLLWDWLRITAAVQAEKEGHTAARFGGDLTLADIIPLELRGGGVISHNENVEGRTPNGGYFGTRFRLPFLTLDAEGDFTDSSFNGRGYVALALPQMFTASDKLYVAVGGDSLDQVIHTSVALENPGEFGFLLNGGMNILEMAQYASLLLTTSSTFGRDEFDERMSQAVGNNLSRIVGRDSAYGFPADLVGIPLASATGRFGRQTNVRQLLGLPTEGFAWVVQFRNDDEDRFNSPQFPDSNLTSRTDIGAMMYYTLPDEVGGIATDGITLGAGGSYAYVRNGDREGHQGEISLKFLIPFIRSGKDFALSISGRGFIDPTAPRNGGGTVLLDGRFRSY